MNVKRIKALFLVTLFLMSSIYSFYEITNTSTLTSIGKSNSDNNLSSVDQKLPKIAAGANKAAWWNLSWSFRISINISAQSGINYTDKLITKSLNFTAFLEQESQVGEFDNNSIRVIEYYSDGAILGETPSQFEPESGYNDSTNALGDVFWVLSGTTTGGTTRYYFIYFDILENGPKETPNYETGLKLEQNVYQQDYTMENNRILISMCEGTPPNGGSYYDHIYQVVDKETGIDQQRSGCHWGWALYSWDYGGFDNTFNGVTELDVVYNGSVVVCVKMVWDYSYYNYYSHTYYHFLYQRYYLINYLDNSVEIRHTITAYTTLYSSSSSRWDFASWWNPGRGDDNYNAPNSAYGLGGYSFYDSSPTLGSDFTSDPELYPNDLNGTKATTPAIKNAAWFVDWDEDLNQGVGTVWNASDDGVVRWGYRSDYNQEGRNIYLYYEPPTLYSGESHEFDIWGIIFNSHDGTYIKDRAKGMQNNPTIAVGSLQDSGKILNYHISDLDGSPIESAQIGIWNSTGTSPMEVKSTDSYGNVSFAGLFNDTFTIKANFTINSKVYLIDQTTFIIDQPKSQRYNFLSVIGNLATTNFYVKDPSVSQAYEALDNATIALSNSTTGAEVTNGNTGIDGKLSLYVFATDYNVSITYLGILRNITIVGSSSPAFTSQNFTAEPNLNITIAVSISENQTLISVVNTQFSKSAAWHSDDLVNYPYYINMYRGDSVNITTFYEDLKDPANPGIPGASSSWIIKRSGGTFITSGSLDEISTDIGNYSVIIDTNQPIMTVGTYILYITLTKTGYESATFPITLNILNHTAQLSYISINSSDNVYWGQNISLYVQYSEISPEISNISSADIMNYSIVENSQINGSLIEKQPGFYRMDLNTSILSVKSYTINIFASKENYTAELISIPITINAIPTNMSWIIPQNDKVSNLLMEVAYGENISFYVNYTNTNGNYIPNTNVFVYVNNSDIIDVVDMHNGLYLCQFNSTLYSPSLSEIKIDTFDSHHQRHTQQFELDILDYWNTQIDLVVPPSFYTWGNNASFIFRYFCNQEPRYNLNLPNGTINQLNITIKSGSNYQQVLNFGTNSIGILWGYQDLKATSYGPGYYKVWFLTNKLNIINSSVFYAEPNVSVQYYRAAQFEPYVWIRPPQTTLTPFATEYGSKSVEKINLYLDQQVTINTFYNVTDTESVLYGNYLKDANVSYKISSFTNSSAVLSSGELSNGNMTGEYTFLLNAIRIGDFKISFTAQLQNYSTAISTIELTVNPKMMNYTLGSMVKNDVITDPQNKELTVDLSLIDPIFNTTLNNANITFIFNGVEQHFSASGTGGKYSYTFSPDMLAKVQADKSYAISIVIQMTNYTTVDIPLTVHVGLPVDPYLNIPYRYWIIFIGTAIAMVTIYGITKGVQYSRIPEVIKQIDKSMKIIRKKKRISGNKLRPLRKTLITDRLSGYWSKVGAKYPKSKEKTQSERLSYLNSNIYGMNDGMGGA